MDAKISPAYSNRVEAKSGGEDHAITSKITPIKHRRVNF